MAVAHYPAILQMMLQNADWTAAVGQAYAAQPDDVMDSVQRLRSQAYSFGNDSTNQYQQVIVQPGAISIWPMTSVIYLPVYDPGVIFGRPGRVVFLGPRLIIGAWLTNDFDWPHHYIYYHGWGNRGWAGEYRWWVNLSGVYAWRYVHPDWVGRRVAVSGAIRQKNLTEYRKALHKQARDNSSDSNKHTK